MQLPSPIKKIPENEVLFDDLFENSANFRDSFNSPIAFDSNPPQNERASINLDKTFRQTDFIEPDVDNPLEEKSIFDSVEQTIQSVKEKASTGNYLDEFKLRKVIRIKGRVVLSPYKGETKKRRIEPKIGEWFNNLEDFSIDQLYFVAKTLIELHEKKKICKIVVPHRISPLLSVAIVDAVNRNPQFTKSDFAQKLYFPILKQYQNSK